MPARKLAKKDQFIIVRATAAQKRVFQEAATKRGLPLATWFLSSALETVERAKHSGV